VSDPVVAPSDARLPWAERRPASVFPWAVWAAITAASLWYAFSYNFTVPFTDEFAWLPQVCHRQPVTFAWLWAQHNEHRMVLPKLIYFGLRFAPDFDCRAGSYWNVAMLAALSAVLLWTARAVRGRSSFYDAFLPMAIQHWGQEFNILWGFQVNFTTSTFLVGLALAGIARCRGILSLPRAVGITLSLVGAGLCGAYGLPFLPALGCWLILAGILGKAAGKTGRLRQVVALTALAAMLFALVIVYFARLTWQPHDAMPRGPWAIFVTVAKFLATGLGRWIAANLWPFSGILVVVGCAWSFAQLAGVIVRRPEERVRALGLLAFLGGMLLLALGIGWGRTGHGLAERYATLAMPLVCLFYLQGVIYSRPIVWRHLERGLFLLMCVFLAVNCHKALYFGQMYRARLAGIERDMRAGIPPEALAVRHGDRLENPGELAAGFEMLREARRGPYRDDAVYRINPAIRAWRLVQLSEPRQLPRVFPFVPGREFEQPFSMPAGMALTRIDVEIGRVHRRPLCKRLDWTLSRCLPEGRRTVLTRGHVDPSQIDASGYVSLAPDRIAFPHAADLALGLSIPADSPQREGVAYLLFDGPTPGRLVDGEHADRVVGSLHAFAFGIQLPAAVSGR